MPQGQLYRKVTSDKGRVSYVPHNPPDPRRVDIDQKQAVALITVIVLSMVMSVEDQYEPHSRMARELHNLGVAVAKFSKLNNEPLEPVLVDVGVEAWNATIKTIRGALITPEEVNG